MPTKKQFMKWILTNIAICVVLITTYSKAGLGATMRDPSLIKATWAIACIPVLSLIFLYNSYSTFKPQEKPVYIKPANALSKKDILEILETYETNVALKPIAKSIQTQLDQTKNITDTTEDIIQLQFGDNSMTSNRYQYAVNQVEQEIWATIQQVLNRMRTFNTERFLSIQKSLRDRNVPQNQREIWENQSKLYHTGLEQMQEQLYKNEKLLTELEMLNMKLLDTNTNSNESSILEEIQTLMDNLQFYKSI